MTGAQLNIYELSIILVSMLILATAEQGFECTHTQMCITLEWTADENAVAGRWHVLYRSCMGWAAWISLSMASVVNP